jgi:hypothetical protein
MEPYRIHADRPYTYKYQLSPVETVTRPPSEK